MQQMCAVESLHQFTNLHHPEKETRKQSCGWTRIHRKVFLMKTTKNFYCVWVFYINMSGELNETKDKVESLSYWLENVIGREERLMLKFNNFWKTKLALRSIFFSV